jgi:hypothetical protein
MRLVSLQAWPILFRRRGRPRVRPCALGQSRSSISPFGRCVVDVCNRLKLRLTFPLLLAQLVLGNALACSAPPREVFASTEKRVRERYDIAESIELAHITHVQRIIEPGRNGNAMLKGERVTFSVDRVFKGRSKRGDKIIVVSTGVCDYSVDGNAALKNTFAPDGGVVIPPRQWLFYRQANYKVTIGETDLAQPIDEVEFDLRILERYRKSK